VITRKEVVVKDNKEAQHLVGVGNGSPVGPQPLALRARGPESEWRRPLLARTAM